jgi:hypothetical protein
VSRAHDLADQVRAFLPPVAPISGGALADLERMAADAVVYYEVDSTHDEKVAALKLGIETCALKLAELGVPFGEIEDVCEDAVSSVGRRLIRLGPWQMWTKP